jgi:phospholipase C
VSKSNPEHATRTAKLFAAPPLQQGEHGEPQVRDGRSRRAILGFDAEATGAGPAVRAASRTNLTGTIKDVKHVVILMQENRAFDHYYGALPGVRGFGDKQVLEYPNGTTIFQQPDVSRTDGGVLLPFLMDSAKYNAQNAGELDHSWSGGHTAWNRGAWNRWVAAKGEQTMGHFTRNEIPFQYSLADAFTICDHYFSSLNGPTIPNRLFHWSGTNGANGGRGGPAIENPANYNPAYDWGTYPEQLEGRVSWGTYANDEVGDSESAPYVGDYGDNPLWLFQAFHDSVASGDPAVQALAVKGGLHGGTWRADSGNGLDVHHVLADFEADCAAGTLPEVSYVISPRGWCEHPAASPDYGAHYQNAVIQALFANQELWESTVLLINYDENDGFFDHVVPPMPEAGTMNEFVDGMPIGYGTRVPMTVVSPWSRGGWVNSQVFDHTSVIRFIETWSGVKDHNISDWRRQVSGDLTSCFDFANPDFSIPTLPDTTALLGAANADHGKPAVRAPAAGSQVMPAQEPEPRRHRPIPYQQNANVSIDRVDGTVALAMSNTGDSAVSMAVYPNTHLPFEATPFTVSKAANGNYRWDATATDGHYDFSAYGPNRFLRRFAGRVIRGAQTDVALPAVTAEVIGGAARALRLSLGNDGTTDILYTLTSHDFVTKRTEVLVSGSSTQSVDWDLSEGYYDVVVTTNLDTGFRYRFAGHIER